MAAIILVKATGIANSDEFVVRKGWPQTIQAYPAANLGAEVGNLVFKNPDGTYDPVTDELGAAIQFTATALQHIVDGLGTYRVEWAARTLAIGMTKARI